MPHYSLGLDFGTNSVRALIVDCADGRETGVGVAGYPSGEDGVLLDPKDHHVARQDPRDYFLAMSQAIFDAKLAATESGFIAQDLIGLGVDTTGSTPIPVDQNGMPLSEQELFKQELSAMAWLWKDHSSHAEAEEITHAATAQDRPYLAKCGGAYSSEWLWAKALHSARGSPKVFDVAHTWMELCDYIPSRLTALGCRVPRSVCAAGHKAMYSEDWGGLPDREFLSSLDPRLGALRDRMFEKAFPSDHVAGQLAAGQAERFGFRPGIPVAVGILDAHAGAVGSAVAPGRMVKILGTSTCDILVSAEGIADIPGVAGIVDGSVIPGMVGIEAGQSAVGDLFAWWSRVCGHSQDELAKDAEALRPGQSGLVALDWNNGNRNVLADPRLTGLLVGQTLHTTAAEIYRALIEATAFGALMIIRRLEEYGVAIDELVACGGIAEKSPLAMQIYADILNRPIRLSRSAQAPALGSAIFGAVVGGAHPTFESAQAAMSGFKDLEYCPRAEAVGVYRQVFSIYERLHEAFSNREAPPVMKELIAIREAARR